MRPFCGPRQPIVNTETALKPVGGFSEMIGAHGVLRMHAVCLIMIMPVGGT